MFNHESDLLFLKFPQQNSIIVRNFTRTHKFFAQFSLIPFCTIVYVHAFRAKCADEELRMREVKKVSNDWSGINSSTRWTLVFDRFVKTSGLDRSLLYIIPASITIKKHLLFLKFPQQNSIIIRNSAHAHKLFAQFSLIPFCTQLYLFVRLGLWWSTCPLVFDCWLLHHVIYLRLRMKWLLAKLRKSYKWQLFSLQMTIGYHSEWK